MHSVKTLSFNQQFSCLGSLCPDTCCKNWDMQIDAQTLQKYQNTTILESTNENIFKRCATGHCVNFNDGLCNIHKDFGDAYLSDACYLFPRNIRKIGDQHVMAMDLSCPETLRLLLEAENIDFTEVTINRLPSAPKTLFSDFDNMFAVHQYFLKLAATDISKFAEISLSIASIEPDLWTEYIKYADELCIKPIEAAPNPELVNKTIIAMMILYHHIPANKDYLLEIIQKISAKLSATIDLENLSVSVSDEQIGRILSVDACHTQNKYLLGLLSNNFYPYFGELSQVTLKYLMVSLALKCGIDAIEAIYKLSRCFDHLANNEIFNLILKELGLDYLNFPKDALTLKDNV